MLTGIFIIVWTSVAGFVVGLLPTYTIPADIMEGFYIITYQLMKWDLVFPIKEMLVSLVVIFIFELTIISINLFTGVIALMRGSGKPEL